LRQAHFDNPNAGGDALARSHYSFNKRQKELAKKKKQEEKRQRRLAKRNAAAEEEKAPEDGEDAVAES